MISEDFPPSCMCLEAKHRINLLFRITYFQVEDFHGFVYLLRLFSGIYFIPEGCTL